MQFTSILHEALDHVRGAQLVGIISTDGLGVDMVTRDSQADQRQIELELSEFASYANAATQRLGHGAIRDFILETEAATYVASQVMPGYYAVIGVTPTDHIGRARFAVKQMAHRLQNEL